MPSLKWGFVDFVGLSFFFDDTCIHGNLIFAPGCESVYAV